MTPLPQSLTPSAETPSLDTDALQQLVHEVLRAGSAQALADASQAYADADAPGTNIRWRRRDAAGGDEGHCVLAHDRRGERDLEMAPPPAALAPRWEWIGQLVQQRLDQLADLDSLFDTVSRLARAERLQRALYTIADLAASSRELDSIMRELHRTVGTLMYAENFYVVLYDPAHDSIRFPYFVDTVDEESPALGQALSMDDIRYGPTWYLLRKNRPFMGSMEAFAAQVDGPFHPSGLHCKDWLGVPMRHGQNVAGGLVVQSYKEAACYDGEDRDLLTYVAQHLQTALARRQTKDELEKQVAKRTHALREANRVLQQQVLERQRGERLQATLFRIAELANTAESPDSFHISIHQVMGTLLYARNFSIALVDEEHDRITFPYSVDEINPERTSRARGEGPTEYVLRNGWPLLARREEIERLAAAGEITLTGTPPVCWLGVPLIWNEKVMGVLAVRSYSPEHTYDPGDQELLTFVSYHIANALQRMQDNEALKQAYADMERRVVERTRALALANRDLRMQVAERERVERRLKYETLHDPLTGLPNRALLLRRLEVAMKRYHSDETHLFAVLFIDLDRFKVINDSVGHLVGDDLLFQVGGRIRTCVKSRDTVARLGGDEFAVLLESIREQDAAQTVAQRIIDSLHQPFRVGVKELFTSASIGISMASPSYRRAEELLRDADSAMYSAKSGGRHRSETFDDRLRRQALEVLEVEGDLRRAITREEFVPYYQPIVHMPDNRIVGYEALLRWRHPERGVLIPGEFLHVAEDAGCAEDIDWQIFGQVCRDASMLCDKHRFISINLSARHFLSPDLLTRLMGLLSDCGVAPQRLRLEVTEGTLLENPVHIKRTLEAFRDAGLSIALDDFGTGYSSLSYMHQYPIGVLKIDQSFVTGLDESETNQSKMVVRAILALARSLRIQVIAEGIETPLQQRVLERMGCRYGQGFLYARAQPAEVWRESARTASASLGDA
jgi:diguanylate cyclase (GGDEF)-like protein